MIELKIDMRDFTEYAKQIEGASRQIPYAMSRSLNDAAFDTKSLFVHKTWPESVTVRNNQFLNWALNIKKSNKNDLTVEIFDAQGQANLKMHAESGTHTSRTGGRLAVPSTNVTLTGHGVRKDQRPANLTNKVVIGNAIYQRVGRGKKLKFMYALTKSVKVKQDVPFYRDFAECMTSSMQASFPAWLGKAMKPRSK